MNTHGCPVDAQLELMLQDLLNEDERIHVENHVEQCLRCAQRLERIVYLEPPLESALCWWINRVLLAAEQEAAGSRSDRLGGPRLLGLYWMHGR